MSESIDLARLRNDYQAVGLDEAELPPDPIELWWRWLGEAQECGIAELNAMIVSTVDADGHPSSRTVLCKSADSDGFVFFTNYTSRKGRAISHEPWVSLLFPWHQISRQVIVTGSATTVGRGESEAYFATRPRGAQISAWASEQSSVVPSREALEERTAQLEAEYDGRDIFCPPHWGGYRVSPATVEFWQGRNDRLHDRLRYVAADSNAGWVIERLSP